MRQTFCVVAGVVLTITLAGCGDTPPEAGPVPFKATNSPAIDALKENMSKNAKGGAYYEEADGNRHQGRDADKEPEKEARRQPVAAAPFIDRDAARQGKSRHSSIAQCRRRRSLVGSSMVSNSACVSAALG